MIDKVIIGFVTFLTIQLYSQNDTIYLSDTILSSVRVMNQDKNQLMYYYIDSNKKKINTISNERITGIIYEDKKIEVFCDLISRKKFLGFEESITIDYGERDSIWLDETIYSLTKKDLKKYNSIIDALNYMGSEGWEVINSYSASQTPYIIEHYILKKEILK